MSNTTQIITSLTAIFSIITGTLILFAGFYWVSVLLFCIGIFCIKILRNHVQRIESEDVIRNVSRETSVKND